jgi:UDP-2,3-diacylglucosamine pyrophosphatase LpxH
MARSIYVISDLHLGGRAPRGPGERGFRIMSRPETLEAFLRRIDSEPDAELVVNGDFVDFLAEEHAGGRPWRAFIADPDEAVAAFEAIYRGASGVFDALGRFALKGNGQTPWAARSRGWTPTRNGFRG